MSDGGRKDLHNRVSAGCWRRYTLESQPGVASCHLQVAHIALTSNDCLQVEEKLTPHESKSTVDKVTSPSQSPFGADMRLQELRLACGGCSTRPAASADRSICLSGCVRDILRKQITYLSC